MGQHRYTLDRYSWEIPEGGVEDDEDLAQGAARELAEETGLTAARWSLLARCDLSNSISDETGAVFLAEGLTAGSASPDGTEELETRWVPLLAAVQMIETGEITDLMSQMGLLMALGRGH